VLGFASNWAEAERERLAGLRAKLRGLGADRKQPIHPQIVEIRPYLRVARST
jgi:hypothetical protein